MILMPNVLIFCSIKFKLLNSAKKYLSNTQQQVQEIAGLLAEKESIPMVARVILIQDLQTNEWWHDCTTLMIEEVREI